MAVIIGLIISVVLTSDVTQCHVGRKRLYQWWVVRIWKEAGTLYVKVISWHSLMENEENCEIA